MKILHGDADGNLVVLMERSEWCQATGDGAMADLKVGHERGARDLDEAERRLHRVYEKIGEALKASS
jgi:hypothetical protein